MFWYSEAKSKYKRVFSSSAWFSNTQCEYWGKPSSTLQTSRSEYSLRHVLPGQEKFLFTSHRFFSHFPSLSRRTNPTTRWPRPRSQGRISPALRLPLTLNPSPISCPCWQWSRPADVSRRRAKGSLSAQEVAVRTGSQRAGRVGTRWPWSHTAGLLATPPLRLNLRIWCHYFGVCQASALSTLII